MDTGENSRSTLAQHAQRLRERTDAICRFSGGLPTTGEGIAVYRDYCEEESLWLDTDGNLPRPADFGAEHEVWFVDAGETVIKFTHPDFFGKRVIYRQDEDQNCLPCEYFERWVLHNEIFGDDVEIFGALDRLPKLISD